MRISVPTVVFLVHTFPNFVILCILIAKYDDIPQLAYRRWNFTTHFAIVWNLYNIQ